MKSAYERKIPFNLSPRENEYSGERRQTEMRMVGGSDCDANIANGIEICAKSRQYKKCFCMKLKSFFLHNLGAAIGYNTIKHPVTNGLRQTKSIFFRMAEKTYVSTSRTLRNGSTHVLHLIMYLDSAWHI